jgi:cytoskeleton protein RodZ
VEPINDNNGGRETREEVSLGRLLKRTREERQIELDEAFRVTRIRRHTLEAFENERWDELPSQVFVKGFLKTYAEFLGLDKEMVIELYEGTAPFEGDKSELLKQVSQRKGRWKLKLILPLLALVFLASIVYFTRRDNSIGDKAFQHPAGEGKEAAVDGEKRDMAEGREGEALSGIVSDREGDKEAISRPESVEQGDFTEAAPVAQKKAKKPPPPRYALTANVMSRTWIAIYVDDQPVEEYLFQAGDTHTWTAQNGFDILVGNAGGIMFVLNGKEIGALGAEGKVVRLKLPQDVQ